MSIIEKVIVHGRTGVGSAASRRLRAGGIVPANLYGHKKESLAIQLDSEVAHALIKDGAKVFDLEVNGELEKALLRDVQWDTFSKHVMHIDFVRVDPNERVHVQVPVILRGTSPGVLAGGILEQQMHVIEVECLAVEVPDSIQVRIGKLQIGESLHVSEVGELPRGVVVLSPADSVVVHVSQERLAEVSESMESDETPVAE